MAVIDHTRSAVVTQPFGGFAETLRATVAGFQAWNDTRITRKSLSSLSDHELADIGIDRSDIDAVARKMKR
ncbi:DUF1127 domain-containing protein [Halocynthiibacter namhaensis]|uniref:DUF1127 domain-containing protein n=1 Tax=Halocynthiibacter namhaensis TaxID=1290553 RepID=UPI0005799D6E|nr:DUF1127 domain-containing protein [Halocynthiibacter namhaensis]